METLSYNILRARQKSYIKAYAILCLAITLSMGFYSYQKWIEYKSASAVVQANASLISALQKQATDESSSYDENQSDFKSLQDTIDKQLTKIFPAVDNYENLTRQLDAFEESIATKSNPFEVSNISFQNPVEKGNYSILPLRMTIKSSPENFQKFLHYVENSGSLDSGVRLMDMSSIRLNFRDASGSEDEIITFAVQINAYFRK